MKISLPHQYLECRDMRHAFEHHGANVLVEQQGQVKVFQRALKCMRCETIRLDTYRMVGNHVFKVGVKYNYPKGYLVRGGLPAGDVRYALFKDAVFIPVEEATKKNTNTDDNKNDQDSAA